MDLDALFLAGSAGILLINAFGQKHLSNLSDQAVSSSEDLENYERRARRTNPTGYYLTFPIRTVFNSGYLQTINSCQNR